MPEDVHGDLLAGDPGDLAGGPEVDPGEDPGVRQLGDGRGEAGEGPDHAGHRRGVEGEPAVLAEVGGQHRRRRFASLVSGETDVVWADEYSGKAGVTSKGAQSGSVRPMAVTGRQKLYAYFVSQQAIAASAIARFSIAISRAFSDRSVPRSAARSRATRFQA